MYVGKVANSQLVRSWELEGIFLDICSRFPNTPHPMCECDRFLQPLCCAHACTSSGPDAEDPTVNNITAQSPFRSAILRTHVALCKNIIAGSPRLAGDISGDMVVGEYGKSVVTLGDIQVLLNTVYSGIGQPAFGQHAFRVLHPYLLNVRFGQPLTEAMLDQPEPLVYSRVVMVDLLLEAHESSLPDSGPPSRQPEVQAGMTILDVLRKRDGYLPVTLNRSFFIFGWRLDRGWTLRSYGDVMEQLTKGRYNRDLEARATNLQQRKIVLALVLFALDHIGGGQSG